MMRLVFVLNGCIAAWIADTGSANDLVKVAQLSRKELQTVETCCESKARDCQWRDMRRQDGQNFGAQVELEHKTVVA